jgi:hypothetical protein
MSYGDNELDLLMEYAEATCELFTELGARGVLVAGGDGDC